MPKDHNLKWSKHGKNTNSNTHVWLQLRTYSKKYELACILQYAAVNKMMKDTHDRVLHILFHANMCYSTEVRGYKLIIHIQ
jgi:hypothetical protein